MLGEDDAFDSVYLSILPRSSSAICYLLPSTRNSVIEHILAKVASHTPPGRNSSPLAILFVPLFSFGRQIPKCRRGVFFCSVRSCHLPSLPAASLPSSRRAGWLPEDTLRRVREAQDLSELGGWHPKTATSFIITGRKN